MSTVYSQPAISAIKVHSYPLNWVELRWPDEDEFVVTSPDIPGPQKSLAMTVEVARSLYWQLASILFDDLHQERMRGDEKYRRHMETGDMFKAFPEREREAFRATWHDQDDIKAMSPVEFVRFALAEEVELRAGNDETREMAERIRALSLDDPPVGRAGRQRPRSRVRHPDQ